MTLNPKLYYITITGGLGCLNGGGNSDFHELKKLTFHLKNGGEMEGKPYYD
jgi:hypothetical protein